MQSTTEAASCAHSQHTIMQYVNVAAHTIRTKLHYYVAPTHIAAINCCTVFLDSRAHRHNWNSYFSTTTYIAAINCCISRLPRAMRWTYCCIARLLRATSQTYHSICRLLHKQQQFMRLSTLMAACIGSNAIPLLDANDATEHRI